MDIQQFKCDVVDSNSWLMVENNNGLLIDAVENESLYKSIRELDELIVILTHSHFDHIIGLNSIRDNIINVKVISTSRCSEFIGNIYRNMSAFANVFMDFYEKDKKGLKSIIPFVCKPADVVFDKQMVFEWNNNIIELVAMYGHSEDGLVAMVNHEYIFTGDTLLNIPTLTRLPTGSSIRFLNEDILFLSELESDYLVYPGHGEPGNLTRMLRNNNYI